MKQEDPNHHIIVTILEDLPALDLEAVRLMRENNPSLGAFFPSAAGIDREALVAAISELVHYTESSQSLARALSKLAAIPLEKFWVLEFGL